jgi:O-antigen/teichoic acid export membrane protein
MCFRVAPDLRHKIAWQRAAVRPLLGFGGWMTVTNVVGPLMVTLDRFLIGAVASVTAVAYYATPYEVVTKLWLIPGALVGVMFPAFSTSFAQDRERTALLYRRSVKYILLMLFPIVLLTLVLAPDGLRIWLGPEFALHSARVLQWLAVGVFINSLAQVPFALVQGVGRPDLTAKLHLVELPFYLFALWWLIRLRGIEGAAIVWTGRAAIDALVLFGVGKRFLPARSSYAGRSVFAVTCAFAALALAGLAQGLIVKVAFLLVTILVFGVVTWFFVLTPEERTLAESYI